MFTEYFPNTEKKEEKSTNIYCSEVDIRKITEIKSHYFIMITGQ